MLKPTHDGERQKGAGHLRTEGHRLSLLIEGGTVATASNVFEADILAEEGRITRIAKSGIRGRADEVVDARGRLVMPGIIDSHVHLELYFAGAKTKDTFETGTRAAAHGGVTTIVNYAIPDRGQPCLPRIDRDLDSAAGQACIDYAIHGVITQPVPDPLDRLQAYIDRGIPSFKFYTTYRNAGLMSDDAVLHRVFGFLAKNGGLPGVHAENDAVTERLTDEFVQSGKVHTKYFPRSRPDFAEEEAITRTAYFAALCGSPLFVVHLSTERGLEVVRAKRTRQRNLFVETCPHYLTLTEEAYEGAKGALFMMSPPLRRPLDRDALWEGLKRGDVDFVSSDHVAYDKDQKDPSRGDFSKARHGIAGIELLPSIVFSEGVNRRGISLQRFVRLTSYHPARIFGMHPRKGEIAVGSDADLVIFDPRKEVTVDASDLHMNVDYSVYEGMTLQGSPEVAISRGEILVQDGEFHGKVGRGRFVERRVDPDLSLKTL